MNSSGPLRILLVINGTDFGGSESALAEIARLLDRRGHSVHVLSLKSPGRIGQRLIEAGMQVDTIGMEEAVSPWNMMVATIRLSAWLRRQSVDVVQSYLPRANIVSRLSNWLVPGYRPHISSERSTDFNRSALTCRLNRWTSRWTDCILVVSPLVREVLIDRDRLPSEKIQILENGLEVETVDACPRTNLRAELGLGPDDLVFCSVGRLIPDKGYKYLVRALANLSDCHQPHLVLVGEGEEEQHILDEVSKLGLGGHVHLVGFREDVLGILKDVDAFVLSSLEEGIPVVLLEAMASRLPVVSTDVGGVSGLVVPGETAILVPPAERWRSAPSKRTSEAIERTGVTALAAALERLALDSNLRHRMGAAGRCRIEEVFDLDAIVDRLEMHYTRLLKRA